MSQSMEQTESAYQTAFRIAEDRYAELGVDVAAALKKLSTISISLHCWQGDDVQGFEDSGKELGGGIAVTGSYPGKASNVQRIAIRFGTRAFADSWAASIEPTRQLR